MWDDRVFRAKTWAGFHLRLRRRQLRSSRIPLGSSSPVHKRRHPPPAGRSIAQWRNQIAQNVRRTADVMSAPVRFFTIDQRSKREIVWFRQSSTTLHVLRVEHSYEKGENLSGCFGHVRRLVSFQTIPLHKQIQRSRTRRTVAFAFCPTRPNHQPEFHRGVSTIRKHSR